MSSSNSTLSHRAMLNWQAIIFIYFVAFLCLLLWLIYGLWPGNDWLRTWFGRTGRVHAARMVTEEQFRHLELARQALARERNNSGTESLITRTEASSINRLLNLAAPEAPAPSSECPQHGKNWAKCGCQRVPVAPKIPEGNRPLLEFDGVSATTPLTATQLKRLSDELEQRAQLLQRRLQELSGNLVAPGFCAFVFRQKPADDSVLEGSRRPWPGEAREYETFLRNYWDTHPVAFYGSIEYQYTLLILLFGSMGAALRGLSSFTRYVGNRGFKPTWIAYYLGMPFLGGGLALGFYAVLRGGFMSINSPANEVTNLYSCIGLAVLVGLASREAQQQIQLIAGSLFAKANPDKDSLSDKDEVELEIDASRTVLTVSGLPFDRASAVEVDGVKPVSFKAKGDTAVITLGNALPKAANIVIKLTLPSGSVEHRDSVP